MNHLNYLQNYPRLNNTSILGFHKKLNWSLLSIPKIVTLNISCFKQRAFVFTGPRSAVGNVSGNRCESDCRSRDREFDPSLVQSHTFLEIDHEIISTVILLPSAVSFKKGCCQLQTKVCAQSTG